MADIPSFDDMVGQHEARMAHEIELAANIAHPTHQVPQTGEFFEHRMRFLAESAEIRGMLGREIGFTLQALDFAGVEPNVEIRHLGPPTLRSFKKPLGPQAATLPSIPGWRMLMFDWTDLDKGHHSHLGPRRVHTKTDGLALAQNGTIYYTRPDGGELTGVVLKLDPRKISLHVARKPRNFDTKHVRSGLANLVAQARQAYQAANPEAEVDDFDPDDLDI